MHLKVLCNRRAYIDRRVLTKTLMVMKITAFLFFAACIQVSAKTYSQSLTLSLKNAPLLKVFTEIEKQSGYSFVYWKELLEKTKNVDLQVSKVSLETVLSLVFKDLE
jgi:hypothetical protein